MRKAWIVALGMMSLSLGALEYEGEARKFIEDDVFKCPSTGMKFRAPDLNSTKLHVAYQETTPGITWRLMFMEELGHVAAVTYTKIRAEYPKTDAVIERVASSIKPETMREGGYLEWCGFLSQDPGKVFQCVVRYPFAGQTVTARNYWLDSMESYKSDVYEIRHYLVRGDYILEFKLFIPQMLPAGSFDEDKLIDGWEKALRGFVLGCGLLPNDDPYVRQMREFQRPDTYFRFVFKDPCREPSGKK